MRSLAIVVMLVACGSNQPPKYAPFEQPQPPVGANAPGGVPGTPDNCCCMLPPSQGMQLLPRDECYREVGVCQAAADCTASDAPSTLD